MFEGLKNKFKNLIDKITLKEEKSEQLEQKQTTPSEVTVAEIEKNNLPTQETVKESEKTEEKIEEELIQEITTTPTVETPQHAKESKKEEIIVKQGLLSKIKNIFSNKIKIKENEISAYFEQLDLELLESDVSPNTAEKIIKKIKEKLIGQEVEKKEVQMFVKQKISETLEEILIEGKLEITRKPFSILLVGPNGMGKTTTTAKLAYVLSKKYKILLAASDTFRKGAIEQIQTHADKLGVKLVNQAYGADPASVAFDAMESAKSQGYDVVIIDTAGRQDNNFNLIKEMEKISRVINPNLTLFVAESVAGQTNIQQIETFSKTIKIDGIIMTKLDCDAKGGTIFSICNDLSKPIYFECFGQEYDQIAEFNSKNFVEKILS